MSFLAAGGDGFEAPTTSDFWQPLIGEGSFAITRASIVMILSVVLISVVLLTVTRKMTLVPSKGQMMTEATYSLVRNSVARDIIGSKDFLKYVPLLFSFFVLILVNNLFGIIPPVQYPTMSRIAFPAVLAGITFVLYHWIGFKKHGFGGWFKAMLVPPGVPGFVLPLLVLLEFVTYFFTRPVTLALRLFGNMFAGHLLLLLFITGGEYLVFHSSGVVNPVAGVFSFGMGFVMTVFEILVEFLQAYIFVLLSALYIAGALADEH